jgi:small GTP-binding protein
MNSKLSFKYIIVGDPGVGKSSLLLKFAEDKFDDNYLTTLGIDFRAKHILINDHNCKLQLWDTAGHEKFRVLTKAYYRGTDCVFCCFDVTNAESFDGLQRWINEIHSSLDEKRKCLKIIVGTKIELQNYRTISYEKADSYANMHGYKYYETSARTGNGINRLFLESAEQLVSMCCGKPLSLEINDIRPKRKQNCC